MAVRTRHLNLRFGAPGATTVRDVLGDPKAWPYCISDDRDGIPDLGGAVILDVFIAKQRLFVHLRAGEGTEVVAVFFIEDQDVRERIAHALPTGSRVSTALGTPLHSH